MASQKHSRSPSVASERSLSSLSDAVIKAGCKAKQKAIKTVKSFTALLKKPRTTRVVIVSDSECKFLLLMRWQIFCHVLADPEPTGDGASMMNVDGVSSRALSVKDRDMPISVSSDDEDTEDKIIKEAEDKIS